MLRKSPSSLNSAMGWIFGADRPRRLALEEAAVEDVVPAAGVGLEPQRKISNSELTWPATVRRPLVGG